MKKNTLMILFLFIGLLAQGQSNPTTVNFPTPIGYINDFDNVFSPVEERALQDFIEGYEEKTGNEISIVTINSIAPYNDIRTFTTELANYWGIGKKDKDNGMIILMHNPKRQIYIATGNGTEEALPNEVCKEVIDTVIIPEFKKGNFFKGIKKGLEELTFQWDKGAREP